MPMIVKHIDKIAREKNMGVLYLTFCELFPDSDICKEVLGSFKYEECTERKQVINWLEANNIGHYECFGIKFDNFYMLGYSGHIYVDLPYDKDNKTYQKLESYLENEDGSMKISNVTFHYLPLEFAMKNAHHDSSEYMAKELEDEL
jgi:hypothetical protein